TWFESRDIAAFTERAWPVSFSAFLDDGKPPATTWIRLRAYPEGKVRDYLGERFVPRATDPTSTAVPPDPPPADGPKLVGTEPIPSLTIDRILQVHLEPGIRGSVRVVLHTACSGTMADLANRASCIDTEATLVPAREEKLDADMRLPKQSDLLGT